MRPAALSKTCVECRLHRGYFFFAAFFLSATRYTNFNADQSSSTAQTLMSTSPDARPDSRTMLPVRSRARSEVFLGQQS